MRGNNPAGTTFLNGDAGRTVAKFFQSNALE
jgi:hypothetical protein